MANAEKVRCRGLTELGRGLWSGFLELANPAPSPPKPGNSMKLAMRAMMRKVYRS